MIRGLSSKKMTGIIQTEALKSLANYLIPSCTEENEVVIVSLEGILAFTILDATQKNAKKN